MNDIPIDDPAVGLRSGVAANLMSCGITTLQIAATWPDQELLRIKWVGYKTLAQLKQKVAEFGLTWADGSVDQKTYWKLANLEAKIKEMKQTITVLEDALDKQRRLSDHYILINRNLQQQNMVLESLFREGATDECE